MHKMATATDLEDIVDMSPGRYVHLGLKKNLLRLIQSTNKEMLQFISEVSVTINIDGVPFFKSTA